MPVCNKGVVKPLLYKEFMQDDKWQQIPFCGHPKTLIYVSHYEEEIPDIVNRRLVLERK